MWVDREYTQHEADYINGLRRENERLKTANIALDMDKFRKYMECLLMERELEEMKKDHEIIVNDNQKKDSKIARYDHLIASLKGQSRIALEIMDWVNEKIMEMSARLEVQLQELETLKSKLEVTKSMKEI